MRKSVLAIGAVVTMAMAGSALAGPGMGPGKEQGYGRGMGAGGCGNAEFGPYSEQQRKFAAEAMPIRQEMMNKRFELQKEYLKEKPDQNIINKLQTDFGELRKKMIDLQVKNGFAMGRGGRGGCGGGMGGGCGAGLMDCQTTN